MPSRPDVGVVVVAAGRGVRAGGTVPKQFRAVGGVPILLRAVRPFLAHPEVGRVVVVLPAGLEVAPPDWLGDVAGHRLVLVAGGAERMDSVERGLAALDATTTVVLVHDGARPFVAAATVDQIITVARSGRGAVAALPVADTLKAGCTDSATGHVMIEKTVSREGLWRAQTPQGFPVGMLRAALIAARAAGRLVTDDAAAVEAVGGPLVLVPDVATNLKVTSADDFDLAEAIARAAR